MSETNNINTQSFSIKELKCAKVVVYTDRAEVKRSVKVKLSLGVNELVFNDATSSIDSDSIRIEAVASANPNTVVVQDVMYQTKRVAVASTENENEIKDKALKLKNELKQLNGQKQNIEMRIERLEKQEEILNEFADNLVKPNFIVESPKDGAKSINQINSKENVDNFVKFLKSYAKKNKALEVNEMNLNEELEKLEEKIKVTQANLDRLNVKEFNTNNEIKVLLESKEDSAKATIFVTYIVYNASWTPKYDVRVFSKERKMTITYHGMIKQSTNEDWINAKISLSTAMANISGNVPELETQNIRLKEKFITPITLNMRSGIARKAAAPALKMFDREAEECDDEGGGSFEDAVPVSCLSAEVKTSKIGSTSTFEIPKTSNIPSDNNVHKVAIGTIEMQPEFEHESVPRVSCYAYIKAKCKNESNYLILPGEANIFFENNFVAKVNLKECSPGEELVCSLGVDPSVRIEYKPVKKLKSESGIISKSMVTNFVQDITIKNTSTNSVKLLLSDNLPLSNDEKIIVKLIEPNLSNSSTKSITKANLSIKLNKDNNIEYDMQMAPGKKEELQIKYSIEYPINEELEFFY